MQLKWVNVLCRLSHRDCVKNQVFNSSYLPKNGLTMMHKPLHPHTLQDSPCVHALQGQESSGPGFRGSHCVCCEGWYQILQNLGPSCPCTSQIGLSNLWGTLLSFFCQSLGPAEKFSSPMCFKSGAQDVSAHPDIHAWCLQLVILHCPV